MSEIGHAIQVDETGATSSSSSYVNPGAAGAFEILGSELVGSANYLLIARVGFGGGDSSANDFEMIINEATVGELTGSHQRIEPHRNGTEMYMPHLYIRKVLTASTPNDYQIEIKTAGTNVAHIAGSELIMINLDDLAAGDWAYDNDAVDNSFVAGVFEDGASITIGDGTSDWLIINTAQWQIDSASDSCRGRIDVGGTPFAAYQLESEDAVEESVYGVFHYEAALATDTVVKNQFTNTASLNDVLDNSIFALRLNAFEDHEGTRNTTLTTIIAAGPVQPVTLTHTADTVADPEIWVAFAMTIIEPSSASLRTASSIRDGSDVDFVGDDSSSTGNMLNQHSAADFVPCLRMGEVAEADGVDLDWDLSCDSVTVNTGACNEQILVGFTWELAVAAGNPYYYYAQQ